MDEVRNEPIQLFNTPVEIGIRSLIILKAIGSKGSDIDKLMYLDHLSLNTHDIGGEASIHAPIPNRGVQVYARKAIMSKGILILLSKGLIELNATKEGFIYVINNVGVRFLEYFDSEYYKILTSRITWVVNRFGNFTNKEIESVLKEKLGEWGSELIWSKSN